jgi:chromosome segregation ATPase
MSSNILYKINKYKLKYNQTTSTIKKREYQDKLSFYQKQLQIGGFDVSRFTDRELADRIKGDSELERRLDAIYPEGADEKKVKRYLSLMEGDIRNVDDAIIGVTDAIGTLKGKYKEQQQILERMDKEIQSLRRDKAEALDNLRVASAERDDWHERFKEKVAEIDRIRKEHYEAMGRCQEEKEEIRRSYENRPLFGGKIERNKQKSQDLANNS